MRNLKWKTHIKKRVQCMLCRSIIHQKPHGKNGWYDMTLCWYCLIKNFIWETPREKLIERKECNMMFATSYYSERLSPWYLQISKQFHTNALNTYEMWNMVDFVKISTRLSQYLVCKYSHVHMTYGQNHLNAKYCIKYNLSPSKQHKLHYLYR